MTMSVARFFDMNPEKVPFFVMYPDWRKRMIRFFRRRGYDLTYREYQPKHLSNKRKLYLVSGVCARSKATKKWDHRAVHHMVLYRGNKPYYDPGKGNRFLKFPCWVWIATRRPKK